MIIATRPLLSVRKDEEEVRKALLSLAEQINRQIDEAQALSRAYTAKFGSELNYTFFDDDGFLRSFGDAKQYKDLILPAANLRPGPSAPTYAAFKGSIYGVRFDNAVTNEIYGSFEIQHDYYEGSDMYFHVHWSPTTTNTGNVLWAVDYSIAKPNTDFPAPVTAQIAYPAPGVVDRHVLHDITTIPGAGLTIGAVCAFRVYRIGGDILDTFTGNAFLHSVGVHYAADTLGSRQVFRKL